MKKITLFVAAVAVLASCNREDALTTQSGGNAGNLNVRNFEKSELQNMITPMSTSFGFNGKASATQVNYTYRGWAEPVQLDLTLSGIPGTAGLTTSISGSGTINAYVNLSASAAWTVNDMVFVVWHASETTNANQPTMTNTSNVSAHNVNSPDPLVGGSITAYKQVGIGQYEFMDRVDFFDADYHEVYGDVNAGSGNYEIMMAGQRAMTTSGYVLANHNGAVITRIDYDYINDEFWEDSFRELPLPGTSANDVVGAARRFYVTTGGSGGVDVTGGVYEFDRNLSNINKGGSIDAGFSGRAIAIDNRTKPTATVDTDDVLVLATDFNQVKLYNEVITFTGVNTDWSGSFTSSTYVAGTTPVAHNILERADITIATSDDNPYTDNQLNSTPGDKDPIVRSDKRIFLTLHQAASTGLVSSVFNITTPTSGPKEFTAIPNIGNAISTEYDAGLDVLYVAMGGGGKAVKVIALDNFANQSAIVAEYDVVGEFADPGLGDLDVSFYHNGTNKFTPSITDVKEITVYGSRNISLAAGNQGVFFIQRDKY
jgi:hypothetical protein